VWSGSEVLIWPVADGNAGAAYRPYWLVVLEATTITYEAASTSTAITYEDASTTMVQPGSRFRVVELTADAALVQAEHDPPAVQGWIQRDDRVQLASPFP
jgi:hypothetical protein